MERNRAESFSIPERQRAETRLAQPRSILQDSLEHGLQVAGRGRNDLQHLGGRGLLLQGLAKLARACVHLVMKSLALQARADPGAQQGRIEGLGQ